MNPLATASSSNPAPLLVACLCAEWCGICRDYAPTLKASLAGIDTARLAVAWVDIEDHDDVLGDIDVQSFPTLLIARGAEPLFFGTVTPHAQTLERLVQGALAGDMAPLAADPELLELVERVNTWHASRA